MSIRYLTKKLAYPIKQSLKYIYGVIPLSIRYGKVFRHTYKFLQESQWWNRKKLEDYQMRQLKKLLQHVYGNVPYYRRIFNERGLKPNNIKSVDDLMKLPYLTKETVRENFSDLVAQNYASSKLKYKTTGGYAGIPFGLYWEKGVTSQREWAFVWRQWNWAEFNFGEKRVTLRGNVINRFKRGKRQWWEYDAINNVLILSSYDMTEENLFKYVDAINKFKPATIQGYPSSLYILAIFLKNSNLRVNQIKCILTSSETLYAHQKETIEEYLGAKIYDHYGNTERNALIMQCKEESYHIISEYGITELIGKDGNPVSEEGEIGEIVATGFNNYAMPFIRYKTGDIAVNSAQKCTCGRNYPLIKKIEGRLHDFLISKRNNLIPLDAIRYEKLEENNIVRQFQFYQDKKGEVDLCIVKTEEYSEKKESNLLRALLVGVEEDIKFNIKYVNNIQRTKSGKYKFLIQKLPIEFGKK